MHTITFSRLYQHALLTSKKRVTTIKRYFEFFFAAIFSKIMRRSLRVESTGRVGESYKSSFSSFALNFFRFSLRYVCSGRNAVARIDI